MKKQIVLIGGGGHCQSVIDVIEQSEQYEILGIVDQSHKIGQKVLSYEIIDSDHNLPSYKSVHGAIITIGHVWDVDLRVKLYNKVLSAGIQPITIISPLAYVSRHARIQRGSVIMHHALVNAGAQIGENTIINSKALVEHGALVGDHCHISTGAIVNGEASIANKTFYGSNATCNQNANIDEFTKAGSVVK